MNYRWTCDVQCRSAVCLRARFYAFYFPNILTQCAEGVSINIMNKTKSRVESRMDDTFLFNWPRYAKPPVAFFKHLFSKPLHEFQNWSTNDYQLRRWTGHIYTADSVLCSGNRQHLWLAGRAGCCQRSAGVASAHRTPYTRRHCMCSCVEVSGWVIGWLSETEWTQACVCSYSTTEFSCKRHSQIAFLCGAI